MNDGGYAFPTNKHCQDGNGGATWIESYEGMSMRAYFAAAALPAEMSAALLAIRSGAQYPTDWREQVSKNCFRQADAMIKAGGL